MARFSYKARNPAGELITGVLEAADPTSAARVLLGRNFTPVNIIETNETETPDSSASKINFLTPRVSLDDLVIFARQMYSLTRAGIPILRAVRGLAETSNSKRMAAALSDVVIQLERGRNISSALNQHSTIFSKLFVSVVHVGENTGRLDEAFMQLSEYLEREQATRKQIKTATRYPTFVVIALAVAMVILNMLVIPVFASMFSKFGADLPLMTQILLGMSQFFLTKWHYMLMSLLGLTLLTRHYVKTEKGAYHWDRLKLRLPIIGSIFERSLLGRFARSFAMMLRSGVPLTTALNLVADAVDNAFVGERIINMRRNIEKGESLSRVANSSKLFTPLVMQMISVGEETGRVDELLGEVAEYYEREVDYDLKSLTAKIEPILISVVAIMVLVLALGIFTPMWDMMGAMKGLG